MPVYEMVFTLRPRVEEEIVKNIKDKIESFVVQNGGELGSIDEIGRKKLAYEVEGEEEGIFFRSSFVIDPSYLNEIVRWMRGRDEVIRLMVIRKKTALLKDKEKKEEKEGEVINE